MRRRTPPYDETRVVLAPTRLNPDGYVNASRIQISLTPAATLKYIAAATPFSAETAVDFWRMVWQNRVALVVQLCQEGGGGDCAHKYHPAEVGPSAKMKLNEFSVVCTFLDTRKSHSLSRLSVKNAQCGGGQQEKRCVYHLKFHRWQCGAVPAETDDFLALLDEVASVRRTAGAQSQLQQPPALAANENDGSVAARKTSRTMSATQASPPSSERRASAAITAAAAPPPPIVVHSRHGAGRTGTYLLVELLLHCVQMNLELSPGTLLSLLRQQRMCLVRTAEQYVFAHRCVLSYLQRDRLI